jgi:polysaccharide biosynthesis protein PslG
MHHMRRHWRPLLVGLLIFGLGWGFAPAQQTAAAGASWCPPQTGFCAEGEFYYFWQAVDNETNGYALDIIGYPISPPLLSPDGLIVQFYERAIFEWHPENDPPYQVELTRLGAALVDNDAQLSQLAAAPPISCGNRVETCTLLEQTNHTLRSDFLQYWLGNGGLPVYGLPLTEEFQATAGNGTTYTVQYFERNRFEYHPENADPRYQVLLGRLGAEVLAANLDEVGTWTVAPAP